MDLMGDSRGQSIQIGAIILFGALIILLSTYQAFVVPDQNRGVEFKHSQTVQNDLKELRSDVISVAADGGESSVSVQLGTEYPSRALFLNPGPPSGSLRTVGTGNASINISVANATATGDAGDFWTGTTRNYSTGDLVYKPNYNEYANAPTTVYSNTVLYNQFGDGNLTLTDQSLISGRSINLIALNGSLSSGQSGSVSVDARATSASATRVPINNSGGNVTIRVPTRLSENKWESLLQSERDNTGYVENITVNDESGQFDELVIEMKANETYNLKLSRVGVGSNIDTTTPATYLVKRQGQNMVVPEGQNVTLAVQARDTYNNPSSGEVVQANANLGDVTDSAESDGDGIVELTYQPPKDIDGVAKSVRVNVSLNDTGLASSSFDSSAPENVTFSLSVDNTNGSGTSSNPDPPAYTIGFKPSRMASNDVGLTCTTEDCTYDKFDDTDSQFRLITATSPTAVGATVDFAVNTTAFGTLSNEDTETDGQGEANATFDASSNGNVSAFVSAGTDSDSIPVELINMSVSQGGFSSVAATDIIPSTIGQNQSFRFTPSESIPGSETVRINLESPQQTSPRLVDYQGSAGASVGSASKKKKNSGLTFINWTAPGSGVSAGTQVRVWSSGVYTGLASQQSPSYDVSITREDTGGSTTTSFAVAGDSGTADISEISVSDLQENTNGQDQTVEFTLDSSLPTGDDLMISLYDPQSSGEVDYEANAEIQDSSIPDEFETTTFSTLKADNATIRVQNTSQPIPAGTYSFTITGVETDSMNGAPYQVNFSRGDADTASATFGSQQPANFGVTIDSFDDPVTEGEDMTVDVTVENTGEATDTQTINLNVDNNQDGNFDINANSNQIELDGGQSQSFTLTYTTQSDDAPEIDFEVTSDNSREERSVTVDEPAANFNKLDATVSVNERGGSNANRLENVEFDFTLDRSDTTTLEIVGVNSATVTGTGTVVDVDGSKTNLPLTIRADTNSGECYELEVPDEDVDGTTYNLLTEGTPC